MIRRTSLITGKNINPILWVIVLALMSTLFLFPIQEDVRAASIQSLFAFSKSISSMIAVFYVLVTALTILVFTTSENKVWEHVMIALATSVVFFGFWIIITPYGEHVDTYMQFGHIQYVLETGGLVRDNANLGYHMFPPFHLINTALAQIAGVELTQARNILLLTAMALLAIWLHIFFQKQLGNARLATLATLGTIIGTTLATKQVFAPVNIAFVFLVMLLILSINTPQLRLGALRPTLTTFLFVLIGFVMSYLPTPAFFICVLSATYILQKVSGKPVIPFIFVAFAILTFGLWHQYWASLMFRSYPGMILDLVNQLLNPGWIISGFLDPGQSYLGGSAPIWSRITRFFWLGFVYGLGGVIGIWNLIRIRKLGPEKTVLVGGLIGVAIFGFITMVTHSGTENDRTQWFRVTQLAPLFTIPLLVSTFASLGRKYRLGKFINGGLICLMIALSFPTFLSHHTNFASDAIASHEISPLKFLRDSHRAEEINLFSTHETTSMYSAHLFNARLHSAPGPFEVESMEALEEHVKTLVFDFHAARSRTSLFVLNDRFTRMPGEEQQPLSNLGENWGNISDGFKNTHQIYSNGYVKIFLSPNA